jgi:phage I-like protein
MNKHKPTKSALHPQHCVVALAFDIELDDQAGNASAPARLRVLPDGLFSAPDGRPGNMEDVTAKSWMLNAKAAQAVIARFKARGLELPLDYEHQTLKSAENGLPAPAAGWITDLTYEPGVGLLADVRWTDAGGGYVAKREYKYLSPVFPFDKQTGEVLDLHSVALTNKPGLTVLGAIAAMAAMTFDDKHSNDFSRRLPGSGRTTNEETTMDKTKVLVALGLALDTGDETALTALSATVQKANTLEQQVVALKANQFDPAKHIPLDEHKTVMGELTALKENQAKAVHEQLVVAALSDARILPANEAYWRKQPLAALQEFLKDAKPLAVLTGTQTGGKPPAGGAQDIKLSEDELAVCKSLGLTPEQFAKSKE